MYTTRWGWVLTSVADFRRLEFMTSAPFGANTKADGQTSDRTCFRVAYEPTAAAAWMFQLCGWLPTATLATASELYGTVAVVGGGATVVAAAVPPTPVLDEAPVPDAPGELVRPPPGGPTAPARVPPVAAVLFPPACPLPARVPVPLAAVVGAVATVVVTPCDVLGGGGAFGSWALQAPTSSAMARGTAATRRFGRRRAE